jgi:hypothetical protein
VVVGLRITSYSRSTNIGFSTCEYLFSLFHVGPHGGPTALRGRLRSDRDSLLNCFFFLSFSPRAIHQSSRR